jgi:hypothetical protein
LELRPTFGTLPLEQAKQELEGGMGRSGLAFRIAAEFDSMGSEEGDGLFRRSE